MVNQTHDGSRRVYNYPRRVVAHVLHRNKTVFKNLLYTKQGKSYDFLRVSAN